MLTIFRRHSTKCPHTSRTYRRCSCPIQVEGSLAGETIRKGLDLTSWDAASKLIRIWEAEGKIGAEGKRVVTVHEAVEKYLRDAGMRLKPSTVDLYRRGLNHLTAWCDAAKVKNLTDLGIEKLRTYRETWTCRPVTAARRIDRLKIFLGFCLESGWIQKNPAKSLKPPEVKVIEKAPFTEAELQSIFEVCRKLVTRGTYGKENVKRVRAFIYILRYTGLRISDAAKLQVSHVVDGKCPASTRTAGRRSNGR